MHEQAIRLIEQQVAILVSNQHVAVSEGNKGEVQRLERDIRDLNRSRFVLATHVPPERPKP